MTLPLSFSARLDADELLSILREVSEGPDQLRQPFFELFQCRSELARAETYSRPAFNTGEVIVTLKPSERLLELLAAARAAKAEQVGLCSATIRLPG